MSILKEDSILNMITESNVEKISEACIKFKSLVYSDEENLMMYLLKTYASKFYPEEFEREDYSFFKSDILDKSVPVTNMELDGKNKKYLDIAKILLRAIATKTIEQKMTELGISEYLQMFERSIRIEEKVKYNYHGNAFSSFNIVLSNFFSADIIGFRPHCEVSRAIKDGDLNLLKNTIEKLEPYNQIYESLLECIKDITKKNNESYELYYTISEFK